MKVLSLFDGISCGRVALDRLNIFPEYYASEIDESAIAISKVNWPDIIQVGDIRGLKYYDGTLFRGKTENIYDSQIALKKFDLVMGGSPCQDLSIIKSKTRKSLDGEKSNLFYEFVRLVREIKPKYFLLENNYSMKDEARDIISEELGVKPIMIDSGLVSAQERKRYYWTNIPVKELPTDKGFLLKDIIEKDVDEKYYYNVPFEFFGEDKKVCAKIKINSFDMNKRVFSENHKVGTLTCCKGGYTQKKIYTQGKIRKLTPLEYERLQTLPDYYTAGFADTHRYNGCGNGWTVEVIKHFKKHNLDNKTYLTNKFNN